MLMDHVIAQKACIGLTTLTMESAFTTTIVQLEKYNMLMDHVIAQKACIGLTTLTMEPALHHQL